MKDAPEIAVSRLGGSDAIERGKGREGEEEVKNGAQRGAG